MTKWPPPGPTEWERWALTEQLLRCWEHEYSTRQWMRLAWLVVAARARGVDPFALTMESDT